MPAAITKSTTASLSTTIAALKLALSRMPTTRITVTSSTTTAAGRLQTSQSHPRLSAGSESRRLVQSAGRWMPNSSRKCRKYFDQP